MSEILIAITLGLLIVTLTVMWFASARTRRLAKFALLVIAVLAALFGLTVIIRLLWFPGPVL